MVLTTCFLALRIVVAKGIIQSAIQPGQAPSAEGRQACSIIS
jgi:hypothetical protein